MLALMLAGPTLITETPLPRRPPSRRHPPARETPLPRRPPTKETPCQGDPPGRRHPPARETPTEGGPPGIRSMSGRYASYWNAFLFILVPFTSSVSVIIDTSIDTYNASIEKNDWCVRFKARTSISMNASHTHSQTSTLTLGVNRPLPLHTGQHCPSGVSTYSSTQFNTGHASRLHSTIPPCLNLKRLERCPQKFLQKNLVMK